MPQPLEQPQKRDVAIRLLGPGDEAELMRFLESRIESSLFFLSNLRQAGIEYRGQTYGGTYLAAFGGGAMIGAAALFWNGTLHLQAPLSVRDLVPRALAASGRDLSGLVGVLAQVEEAKQCLGLKPEDFKMDEAEILYALELSAMTVPPNLLSGVWQGRRIQASDLEIACAWVCGYAREALGDPDGPELRERCRQETLESIEQKSVWFLEADGRPVSRSAFNAALPEIVQVGGVYTPPELRGRGYARAAVAASLLEVRVQGVRRAVLFTGNENRPAQKAYASLGFRRVGEFAISLLKEPRPAKRCT